MKVPKLAFGPVAAALVALALAALSPTLAGTSHAQTARMGAGMGFTRPVGSAAEDSAARGAGRGASQGASGAAEGTPDEAAETAEPSEPRPAGRRSPSTGGSPQRIISLTPSVTETLFAIGAGPRVVAVSSYCDYPPEVSTLPRVGTFLDPVIEAVIYLEPDLVISSPSPGNENAVRAIEAAGIRVAVVEEGSGSVAEVRRSIRETARLVGRVFEGFALISSIDGTLEAIRSATSGRPPPAVAVVVGHEPLVLAGPESYLGELVEIGGGSNIADELGGKWPRTSWEFLLDAEPEVIIDASADTAGISEAEALARRWSSYAALPAVASGRVHGHASHLLLRPGPRLGDAARVIARWIHPYAWN